MAANKKLPFTLDRPQSFHDRKYFPKFSSLPGGMTAGPQYHDRSDGLGRRHIIWCLLGEIIEANTFIRARIVARDYAGHHYVVGFYPDSEKEMERLYERFAPGNAIAILNPYAHGFMDGSSGVRVEEPDQAIIMPLSRDDFFAMNEELIKYTPGGTEPQRCHGCDEIKESYSKCGACGLFNYCNRMAITNILISNDKECQVKGWKGKLHTKFCKALKDENVRWLSFLDYDNGQECPIFQ